MKLYKYNLFIKEGEYEEEAENEKELIKKAIFSFQENFGLILTEENIVDIEEVEDANIHN
jgi:hypothetical protein